MGCLIRPEDPEHQDAMTKYMEHTEEVQPPIRDHVNDISQVHLYLYRLAEDCEGQRRPFPDVALE